MCICKYSCIKSVKTVMRYSVQTFYLVHVHLNYVVHRRLQASYTSYKMFNDEIIWDASFYIANFRIQMNNIM